MLGDVYANTRICENVNGQDGQKVNELPKKGTITTEGLMQA